MNNMRFVAHIDVLGMSSLVEKDAELAWQLLSDLVSVREETHRVGIDFLDTAERVHVPDQIQTVTFSDTIVLFTKGESLKDLRSIIVVTTEFLNKALNLCIPVRAGIAFGTFFFNLDKSMYAGPALIEAYHLGEAAQWIGITTSKEVYQRSKAANFQSGRADVVISAPIPLKGKKQDGYAVNWPAIMATSINAQPPLLAPQIYEGFSQYFGPWESLPFDVKAKYENTAHFINAHYSGQQ
ncbi:MAG: hypothetical protein PSV40_06145 [Polaromonas sp.]|uniref:hypothetical protein n=1 Tax=Polaromonas sp. TaxID=1869339 RepID=UPI002486CE51|nr:hypothetical protein [Polaromonas sp.]MDI1268669.1 hypothetical protein [Polaromonas sp.]